MEMSKKRAVTYARSAVAGSKDIEDQLRICRIFAANKGYKILREYVDDGMSGNSLDRDGLSRLRKVLKTGGIEILLVTSLSRLAREPQHIKMLLAEIRSANVTIELAK